MTVERIDFYEDGTCEVVPASPIYKDTNIMTTAEYNRAVSKFDDELDGIFAEDWRNLSESWRLYITETFVTDENVESDLATQKAEEYIRMGYAKAHDLNLDSAFVLSVFLTEQMQSYELRGEDVDVGVISECRDVVDRIRRTLLDWQRISFATSALSVLIKRKKLHAQKSYCNQFPFADRLINCACDHLVEELEEIVFCDLLGKSVQEKHARNLALLVFSKASE